MSRSRRDYVRPFVVALLLALPLRVAPAQAADTTTAATPSVAAALANIHIDNFGRINDHYYRGSQPKGDDFQALAALGIKLDIDLAGEGDPGEAARAKAAGIQFVRIPMTTHAVPTPAVIAQFLSLVSDPANQPVYVHCIGGRHRTGVMTAIYRMTIDKWNAARAFSEMEQYKFGAAFLHPEFKDFIEKYVPAASVQPSL